MCFEVFAGSMDTDFTVHLLTQDGSATANGCSGTKYLGP